jgi:hypothetical protein
MAISVNWIAFVTPLGAVIFMVIGPDGADPPRGAALGASGARGAYAAGLMFADTPPTDARPSRADAVLT